MIRNVVLTLVLAASAACDGAAPRPPAEARADFSYPLARVTFEPLNARSRAATGSVRFYSGFRRAGQVHTGNGHIYQTVPVRMPQRGGRPAGDPAGWERLLPLSADAQVELRQVRGGVTPSHDAPSGLCGEDSPKWLLVALDTPATDPRLLLGAFRGSKAPAPGERANLCGVYEYEPVT